MPLQPKLQHGHYVFASSAQACPVPSFFFCFTEILQGFRWKFTGCNHYHEQIKRLHFGQYCNGDKGAGYNRIFQSTTIGFAMMSKMCWFLANTFTDFTAQTKTDAIIDKISR